MNCTHCKHFQLFPITDDGCRHPDLPNEVPCPGFEPIEEQNDVDAK